MRWQSLAEELGLGPEPSSPQAGTEADPPVEDVREAPRRTEEAPQAEMEDLPEARTEEGEEAPAPRGRRRRGRQPDAPLDIGPVESEPVEAAEPAAEGEDLAPTATAPTEEGAPRGRRRRRRGRKSQSAEPESATEAAGTLEGRAEGVPEEGEEERPRRRRRRGKKTAVAEEASTGGEEDEASELDQDKPKPALEEEEETEDFSTWNIPSWSEIIASLYRPER
jgi:ribonuclease E